MGSQSDNSNIDTETEVTQQAEVEDKGTEKECFVIMPISDSEPYEEGHFKLVYEHLIKPACFKAGFNPIRADDVKATNLIVGDVIGKLVNADMAICDLSGRNPNVLFELGIRQAFDLPVTLIKDTKTSRIFDIQGLRDVPYDEHLRVDNVKNQIIEIKDALKNTYDNKDGKSNSLIHLLSIHSATLPQKQTLNPETSILLEAIKGIGYKIAQIEGKVESNRFDSSNNYKIKNLELIPFEWPRENCEVIAGIPFKRCTENALFSGQKVQHSEHGIGTVVDVSNGGVEVKFDNGREVLFSIRGIPELKVINS